MLIDTNKHWVLTYYMGLLPETTEVIWDKPVDHKLCAQVPLGKIEFDLIRREGKYTVDELSYTGSFKFLILDESRRIEVFPKGFPSQVKWVFTIME